MKKVTILALHLGYGGIENAITKINEYININKEAKENNNEIPVEYIIIHNPRWLGVTSATKELFKNLVPLEEVFLNKNVDKISNMIIKSGVSQVIFSAFDYGWDKIAIKLKSLNPDIKIKSFWHGSHSQVIEKINWETNVMIIFFLFVICFLLNKLRPACYLLSIFFMKLKKLSSLDSL